MLIILPKKYRAPRGRIKAPAVLPVGPQLVLQSAAYEATALSLTLYFDENIDFSALDGSQISVNDPTINNKLYLGTGSVSGDGNAVQIGLIEQGPANSGDAVTLDASGSSGIVGSDDGAVWAGVSGYVLE